MRHLKFEMVHCLRTAARNDIERSFLVGLAEVFGVLLGTGFPAGEVQVPHPEWSEAITSRAPAVASRHPVQDYQVVLLRREIWQGRRPFPPRRGPPPTSPKTGGRCYGAARGGTCRARLLSRTWERRRDNRSHDAPRRGRPREKLPIADCRLPIRLQPLSLRLPPESRAGGRTKSTYRRKGGGGGTSCRMAKSRHKTAGAGNLPAWTRRWAWAARRGLHAFLSRENLQQKNDSRFKTRARFLIPLEAGFGMTALNRQSPIERFTSSRSTGTPDRSQRGW